MKKILIGILLLWIVIAIALTIQLNTDDNTQYGNDNIIIINRLVHDIVSDYEQGIDIETKDYMQNNILSEKVILSFKFINTSEEKSLKSIESIAPYPNLYVLKTVTDSGLVMMFEVENLSLNQSRFYRTFYILLVVSVFCIIICTSCH